jgi:hypothetical protein
MNNEIEWNEIEWNEIEWNEIEWNVECYYNIVK